MTVGLPPFFDRVYGAVGGHLAVSRESLERKLQGVIVGLHCAPSLDENELSITELAINLLSRLYPQISIEAPDEIRTRLAALARSINPQIALMDGAPAATTICIGQLHKDGAIHASSSGWVARLAFSTMMRRGPTNPYGAGAAAALAVGALFRRIFLDAAAEKEAAVSLLNFDEQTGSTLAAKPHDLGEVLYVGAGAVGNAGVWALSRHRGLRGSLTVIDPEQLTLLNLQRYVLGTVADVSRWKVHLVEDVLKSTALSVRARTDSLDEFAKPNGLSIPTVCISVDNVEGRRAAQALLPQLIINGWTGEHALGASWHSFSNPQACLACLYHPHGRGVSATEQAARVLGLTVDRATLLWIGRQPLSEEDIGSAARALNTNVETLSPWRGKTLGELYTDVVCGAAPINLGEGAGHLETVPLAHQSALAGILMASELVKRTNKGLTAKAQPEPLVSWDNVLQPSPSTWRKPRARELGCICGDEDYQSIYLKKWKANSPARSRSKLPTSL